MIFHLQIGKFSAILHKFAVNVKTRVIKKVINIISGSIAVLAVLLAMLYLLLMTPFVQTRLVNFFTRQLELRTGMEVSIGRVDFRPLESLLLEDVVVKDYRMDTMLFARRLAVQIDSLSFLKQQFTVSELRFEESSFHLWVQRGPSGGETNVERLLSTFSPPRDTLPAPRRGWKINITAVVLEDCCFTYREDQFEPVDYGINWTDVDCREVYATVSDIDFSGGKYRAQLSGLRLKERSGFALTEVNGVMVVDDCHLEVSQSLIRTERSEVHMERLMFDWVPDQGYWRYFTKKMQQYYLFSDSRVHFDDIAYFNGYLLGMDNTMIARGEFFNTIEKFSGNNIVAHLGEKSVLHLDFTSIGLPRFFDTDFTISFTEGKVSPEEMNRIYMPWLESHYLGLPEQVCKFDVFDLSGTFQGKIEDFHLAFRSETPGLTGEITLTYAPDTTGGGSLYRGDVNFDQVDYGFLSGTDFLKNGNFRGRFNGGVKEEVSFFMNSRMDRLRLFDAQLRDIHLMLGMNDKGTSLYATVENDSIQAKLLLNYGLQDSVKVLKAEGELSTGHWNRWAPSLFGHDESVAWQFSVTMEESNGSSFLDARVTDFTYQNSRGSINLDTVSVIHVASGRHCLTELRSDALDFSMNGDYKSFRPGRFIQQMIQSYLPSYRYTEEPSSRGNISISCEATFKEINPLLEVVYPELTLAENTRFVGVYDETDGGVDLRVESDSVSWKMASVNQPRIRIAGDTAMLTVEYRADQMRYGRLGVLYNVRNIAHLRPDNMDNDLTWNNWEQKTYSGAISANLRLARYNDRHVAQMVVHPGVIIMGDTIWNVKRSLILKEEERIFVNNFEIHHDNQAFRLNGKIGDSPRDTLLVQFDQFNLAEFNQVLFQSPVNFFGTLNGRVQLHDRLLYADMKLSDWGVDGDTLGVMDMRTHWDALQHLLQIDLVNTLGEKTPVVVSGFYHPEDEKYRVKATLSDIDLKYVNAYFPEIIQAGSGSFSGELELNRTAGNGSLDGYISLDAVMLKIGGVNTSYFIDDQLIVRDGCLLFDSLTIRDDALRRAGCSGYYDLTSGKYDINVKLDHFRVLNAEPTQDESLYGQLFLTGAARINNLAGYPEIASNLRTGNHSRLFIPLAPTTSPDGYNFLHFRNNMPRQELRQRLNDMRNQLPGKMALSATLEVTDGLELQMIFDPMVGDILKSVGRGNIQVTLDGDNRIGVFGDYVVERGDYLFTMGNLVNKKFVLNSGGSIAWNGSPYDATMDVTATYNLRTTLSDLQSGLGLAENHTKVPVECVLNLTGNLSNPTVVFELEFPSLDVQDRSLLQSIFVSQDDINKQVFSLLVLNRFYMLDNIDAWGNAGYQAGVSTASELLSNQLSHWLSQISSNFDVDFSYRPGYQMTSDEFELALSTQIFNNRVTLSANGNVIEGAKANNNASITGDFDIEVKLDKPGTLKLKAYSHTDEKITYDMIETVHGVGVSYQENFDTFRELFRKHFGFLYRRKHKNPKP